MKLLSIVEERDLDGILCEDGLSRVFTHSKKPFAVLTAFRDNYTLAQNRQRNRSLESALKQNKMGGIRMIGHWMEAPDGTHWKDAVAQGTAKDVTEESYFIPMPASMEFEKFKYIIQSLTNSFNQDAAVIGDGKGMFLISKSGQMDKIGSAASFNKISQAYSKLRKRPQIPFVFEGTINPSSIAHRISFQRRGLKWYDSEGRLVS
jgi:hypothetical protein